MADRKEYYNDYNHSERGKIRTTKHYNSGTYKIYIQSEKYKKSHNKAQQKYVRTKKGKFAGCKKSAKRRKDLGFILLFDNPFSNLELIHWHHINDEEVIAIPKDLHYLYYGKNHRENTMEIIKQIYGD